MKLKSVFVSAAVFVFSLSVSGPLCANAAEAEKETEDTFVYASDYEQIYEALYALYDAEPSDHLAAVYGSRQNLTEGASGEDGIMLLDSAADYSETNLQEAGVDEADIIKTDGDYIYILNREGSFSIVSVVGDQKEPKLVSTTEIQSEHDLCAEEFYLTEDRLSIIASEYMTFLEEDGEVSYTNSTRLSALYTYDITDPAKPVLLGSVTQEGTYRESRRIDGCIYLFSSWTPTVAATYEDSVLAPLLNGEKAPASSFYLPPALSDSTCLVISSVSDADPGVFTDSKILVSGADLFYVSTENIYIASENLQNANTLTEITKFHFENGLISGVAANSVTGYLNNSFSMNEYDGSLRLVTTYFGDDLNAAAEVNDWTEHNALYILDASLAKRSVIADLAAGETVRSARFLGQTGYFVTYRQTDPLFSVDLSDPDAPQILGELKISGFSSYLHFYGDEMLLGLGYETDESGSTLGLKLSMFDISDPSDVKECAKYVIPGVNWCESFDNYKSILVDPEKNLIGFYCNDRYLVFSYDENEGFLQEMIYDFYSDQLAGRSDSSNMRGLYSGDSFYLAGDSFVIGFDMRNDFEKTSLLTFD